MNRLNNFFSEHEKLFEEADESQVMQILFVQLKDECEQLIRMESKIFIPFIKSNLTNKKFILPEGAVDKIYKNQELLLALFYRIKLSTKNFLSVKGFNSSEQIMINDFMTLEQLLSDWIFIMRNRIIDPIKYRKNEFA